MNPTGAKAGMLDDFPATQGAMLIVAMVLIMGDKRVHVFHVEGFQLVLPFL